MWTLNDGEGRLKDKTALKGASAENVRKRAFKELFENEPKKVKNSQLYDELVNPMTYS